QSRVSIGSFTIGGIAKDRTPHVASAHTVDPQLDDPAWTRRDGMVTFAGYPLLADTKLVGVMALFSRRELSPAALDALNAIARSGAVTVERKRMEAELARQTRLLQEAHDTQRRHAEQLTALVEEERCRRP